MLAPKTRKAYRPHGTRGRFLESCRCEACRDANKEYQRLWNHKAGRAEPTVKTADVLRYVECLASFGLEYENIAEAIGVGLCTVRSTKPAMHRQTARKIESLHWGLHYRHYPFRQHCQCAHDLVVLESFEEVTS